MPEQIDEKEWVRQMGQKFLKWRQDKGYTGQINVPEVARWTMEVSQEIQGLQDDKTTH